MALNAAAMLAPAIFIDKDGTLVLDVPYNIDASRIVLREGAGPALARLFDAGFVLVLVTNQPGIAQGRYVQADLDAVWNELNRQLAPHGVHFTAIYYCPHDPDGSVALYAHPCECRKPRPGMLLRAARQHRLDLGRSWMIGDILDDVEAGHAAGCRAVLLDVGSETEWRQGELRQPDFVAPTLMAAAGSIVGQAVAA
jgi:D,D-heptose 1,7-bisphosphate phosphatase